MVFGGFEHNYDYVGGGGGVGGCFLATQSTISPNFSVVSKVVFFSERKTVKLVFIYSNWGKILNYQKNSYYIKTDGLSKQFWPKYTYTYKSYKR